MTAFTMPGRQALFVSTVR